MIGYLHGNALGHNIVLVGGVGYLVTVPGGLDDGAAYTLHVVTIVREDALDLYGFETPQDAEAFRLLLKGPGIGPRLAIAMLEQLGAAATVHALAAGDTAALSRTSGVGPKVAAKLIAAITVPAALLEIYDAAPAHEAVEEGEADDLVGALVNFGFDREDAVRAAASARQSAGAGADEATLIKTAMRTL
jgi:Holliday junction DNA helicase RuvA